MEEAANRGVLSEKVFLDILQNLQGWKTLVPQSPF